MAAEPVYLHPPLREVWRIDHGSLPIGAEGRLFFGGRSLVCRDEATGAELWAVPFEHGAVPKAIWRDRVIVETLDRAIVLLDAASGANVGEFAWPPTYDVALVDRLWVAQARYDDAFYAADLMDGRILWRHPLRSEPPGVTRVSALFSMSPEAAFVGRADGRIQAISLADGSRLWETNVAHLRSRPTGEECHGSPMGWSYVCGDIVVFWLWADWAVGLSTDTGEIVWQRKFPCTIASAQLYAGHYYVVTCGLRYHIVDAASGALLVDARLADLPARLLRRQIVSLHPIIVSETHLFGGADNGIIIGFERETGRYVWHHKQTHVGAFQGQTYFVSMNGRLFYAEMCNHLHCMEEVRPTDPGLSAARAAGVASSGERPRTRRR